MSLYRQKNSKFWWVKIYHNGKMIRKSTGKVSKAEALQVEQILKDGLNKNVNKNKVTELLKMIYPDDVSLFLSFEQIWSFYLVEVKRRIIGERLLKERKLHFLLFEKFCFKIGINNYYDVTRQIAISFIDSFADSDKKGKTINNIRASLVTVINAVMVRANLLDNVFLFVKTVSVADSLTGRAFNNEELLVIFERCSVLGNEYVGLYYFLLYTGLRLGDVVNLKKSDIKNNILYLIPGKTAKHKITVRIPLHCEIIKWCDSCSSDALFSFLSNKYKDGKIPNGNSVFADFDKRNYKIGWHCFRHTFRSKLSEAGADIEVAKMLLGHSSDAMSMHYNHDLSKVKEAIDKL